MLGILADPKHPKHQDMREWLEPAYPDGFDPEAFDRDAINEPLADGLDGVYATFDDPSDDDDGATASDGNIIPFPKR